MKFLASALLILVALPIGSSLAQSPTKASPSQPQAPATGQDTTPQSPGDILRDFKSYYIKSDTMYLHRETLLKELEKRGEFSAWDVTATEDPKAADVIITITLPFLTWEWNYRMVHQPTGTELGTGKVSAAVEKTAAPQLAAMIVKRIRELRPLPDSFQKSVETPQVIATASPEKGKSWKVRYISGPASGLPEGARVTLTLNRESMTVRNSKAVLFSAPVQNLSATDSRTEVHKATKGWEDFWDTAFNKYVQAGDGKVATAAPMGIAGAFILAVAIPTALVGEGILAPIKTTDHFVSMYWLEDGTVRNAEFRANTHDTKSLLAELNRVTGREVEDLQQLSPKRLNTIAKQFDASPIVQTDQQVSVGWRSLAPGTYRLVVVPRERNLAEIYLFPGNFQGGSFNANDVAAHAVVEFERRRLSSESKTAPSVSYKEQNGIVVFSQIQTDEYILRFTPVPLGSAK